MRCTRKRQAIAHDVGAVCFYWANVSSLDFGPTAAVDKLQPGDGTALIIRPQNNPPKHTIAYNAGYNGRNPLPRFIENKRRPPLAKSWFGDREICSR